MNTDQFTALAELCRMRTSSRTAAACREVLVDGLTASAAARKWALKRQTVHAQCQRLRKALELSRRAVAPGA